MKVLVAYDGTLQSKEALRYGMEKVREKGGELVALNVFDNNIFIGYDSDPRAQELARIENMRYVDEAKRIMSEEGKGLRAAMFVEDGDPEEAIISFAREANVDILLCPPRFKALIRKYKKVLNEEGKRLVEDAVRDETNRVRMAVVSRQ